MNQKELVDVVTKTSGYPRTQVESTLYSLLKAIEREVASGGVVRLVNFGTFKTLQYQERNAINPVTGAPVIRPAKKVPKFSAGKKFKDAMG